MSSATPAARRIVVVGSVNTDLTARVTRFPLPGETVPGHTLAIAGGGKGANAAVAAARLGGRVALIAAIGDDAFGAARRVELVAAGLDLSNLVNVQGIVTGIALIGVDDEGQNTIVVVPGANDALRREHLTDLPLASGDVLVTQLESPLDTVERALRLGAERGATTVLNFAPYRPAARALLTCTEVIVVNEHEAAGLLDMPVSSPAAARQAAPALLARGPRAAVITLGADGAMAAAGQEVRHIPASCVTVVDTTAAGDAVTGALAVELAAGTEFFAAVGRAVLAGTLTVTKPGAQPSLPWRAEVEQFRRALEAPPTVRG